MIARLLYTLVILAGLPAWLIGLAVPVGWLLAAALHQAFAPAAAPSLTWSLQGRLHLASLVLMLLASLLALLLAALAAFAFARVRRRTAIWVSAAVLIIPPLVYGYLWYLVFSRHIPLMGLPTPYNLPIPAASNLAISSWSIALWLWPVPAILLTLGWQWAGRPAWALARLDGSDLAAFARAALPAMRPQVLAALAVCLVLVSQEYAVPALFSVQVWQTQWLAMAQAGEPLGRLTLAALPAGGLLLALLGAAALLWRSHEPLESTDLGQIPLTRRAKAAAWAVLAGGLLATIALPAAGAAATLNRGLTQSLSRFEREITDTSFLMVAAGTLASAAALAVVRLPGQAGTYRPISRNRHLRGRWVRPLAMTLALATWVLPVSLVAEAARQAQLHAANLADAMQARLGFADGFDLFGRQASLVVWICVLAGRMLPIAWLVLAAAARSMPSHLPEQAAIDGASRSRFAVSVAWPLLGPALLGAWLICGLLVATESAAATMLQLPGFDVLAVSLLNHMHYGRDADVIAVCLLMVAFAGGVAGLVAAALGRATQSRRAA